MILDELKAGDKFKCLGKIFTVTNISRGYRIKCIDDKGDEHYLRREIPINEKKRDNKR